MNSRLARHGACSRFAIHDAAKLSNWLVSIKHQHTCSSNKRRVESTPHTNPQPLPTANAASAKGKDRSQDRHAERGATCKSKPSQGSRMHPASSGLHGMHLAVPRDRRNQAVRRYCSLRPPVATFDTKRISFTRYGFSYLPKRRGPREKRAPHGEHNTESTGCHKIHPTRSPAPYISCDTVL